MTTLSHYSKRADVDCTDGEHRKIFYSLDLQSCANNCDRDHDCLYFVMDPMWCELKSTCNVITPHPYRHLYVKQSNMETTVLTTTPFSPLIVMAASMLSVLTLVGLLLVLYLYRKNHATQPLRQYEEPLQPQHDNDNESEHSSQNNTATELAAEATDLPIAQPSKSTSSTSSSSSSSLPSDSSSSAVELSVPSFVGRGKDGYFKIDTSTDVVVEVPSD